MLMLAWFRFGPGINARVGDALAAPAAAPALRDEATLNEVASRIRRAARFVPGSRCLDRSLLLFTIGRQLGIPATLRLGVRRGSGAFSAHAWICLDGMAIGEDAEALKHLVPFPTGKDTGHIRFD